MTEPLPQPSWLSVIAETAKAQGIPFPSFTGHAMGSARSVKTAQDRYVTFRRRLVPASQAENDGVEWGLWYEQDDRPVLVAAFREALQPTQDNVAAVFPILKGWLVDEWAPETAQAAVGRHLTAQVTGVAMA
jgi:hypothetical protein